VKDGGPKTRYPPNLDFGTSSQHLYPPARRSAGEATLDAVHQGVPFVSSGLSGHVSELSYTQAPNRLHADEVLASPAEGD